MVCVYAVCLFLVNVEMFYLFISNFSGFVESCSVFLGTDYPVSETLPSMYSLLNLQCIMGILLPVLFVSILFFSGNRE